jgi:arginyl-tRNA synthetase
MENNGHLLSVLIDVIANAFEKLSNQDFFINGFTLEKSAIKLSIPNEKINAHYCTNILFLINQRIHPHMKESFLPQLKTLLLKDDVIDVQFLGGYINFKMSQKFFANITQKICSTNILPNIGNGQKVNVEYCSINPTGFLHIGHARSSFIGDAIARMLQMVNYDITKEFFINDAGNQIKMLGMSVMKEYAHLHNIEYKTPEEAILYQNEDIQEAAKAIPFRENYSIEDITQIAVNYFLQEIKKDLKQLEIHHDSWISERDEIRGRCWIEKAMQLQNIQEHLYEGIVEKQSKKGTASERPLLLLKTTSFGDAQDRPVKKQNGDWTYLAVDIGYHLQKIDRGATKLICVLGADHDSSAQRIKIAVQLLANVLSKKIEHNIILCQMVSFEENGLLVKFSKRAGNTIRTAEFIKAVHPDVLRFIMLSKNPNTQFVFDYEKSVSVSMNNPVFYVHYAYARACSILRKAFDVDGAEQRKRDLEQIMDHPEGRIPYACVHTCGIVDGEEQRNVKAFETEEFQKLIIVMSSCQNVLEEGVKKLAPHIMTEYCYKLAEAFHQAWQAGKEDETKRFIAKDENETLARLAIVDAFLVVMGHALKAIGVKPMEKL